MIWVILFLVMFLYAIAVVCTRLIGHGALVSKENVSGDEEHRQSVINLLDFFASVSTSTFTLFLLMSNWALIRFMPLFDLSPFMKMLFVIFYIFASWALLAVMTGVVSEKMIVAKVEDDPDDEANSSDELWQTLRDLFNRADTDNSRSISQDEFKRMLK